MLIWKTRMKKLTLKEEMQRRERRAFIQKAMESRRMLWKDGRWWKILGVIASLDDEGES